MRGERPVHSGTQSEKFRQLTVAKNIRARVAQRMLRRGEDAYPQAASRPAGLVPKPLGRISRVCFLGDVVRAMAQPPPEVGVVEGASKCRAADLVIVNGVEKLFRPPSPAWVVDLAYVVGFGRPVVALGAWQAAKGVPSAIHAKDQGSAGAA